MHGANSMLPMIGATSATAGEAKNRAGELVESIQQRLADMGFTDRAEVDLVDHDATVTREDDVKIGFPITRCVDKARAAVPMGLVDAKFAFTRFVHDLSRQAQVDLNLDGAVVRTRPDFDFVALALPDRNALL